MSSNPYQPPLTESQNVCCSFCRKTYREAGPLVEGPGEIFICRSCAELCVNIIDEEHQRRKGQLGLQQWLFHILFGKPKSPDPITPAES